MSHDYPILFSVNQTCFYIHTRVVEIWTQYKQIKHLDKEGFGVIIGRSNHSKKSIYIDYATTPQKLDKATRSSFLLQDPAHQQQVDKIFIQSNQQQGYLGTWHTHAEAVPYPSSIDITDWGKCISRNLDRQLCFFIVGTEKTALFVKKDNTFIHTIEKRNV